VPSDDEVTLGELRRAMADLRASVAQQVTQKVFDAEMKVIVTRIDLLVESAKEAEKERRADRRVIYGAFASGVVAILLNIYTRAQGVS
jgi:hypothetical protein